MNLAAGLSARFDFIERASEYNEVLNAATRRIDQSVLSAPERAGVAGLPVHPALIELVPDGLRRGSTVAVSSVSLVLALLGAASTDGAWCALVGLPPVSAEAAQEYGIDPSRLIFVQPTEARWITAVGALLDAFDIVVARPPARLPTGDSHRVTSRTRTRGAVFMPFAGAVGASSDTWSGAELRLQVSDGQWSGLDAGHGRLRGRQVTVTAQGRGRAARPRHSTLWLPAEGGGIAAYEPLAPVVALPKRAN